MDENPSMQPDLVRDSRLVPQDALGALVAPGIRHKPSEGLNIGQLPGAGRVLFP